MIFTTTNTIEGKKITNYLGMVTGADFYLAAGLIGEGLVKADEHFSYHCDRIRNQMISKATALGADGIVGVQMNFSIGQGHTVYLSCVGTAVNFEDADTDELPDL